MVLVWSVDKPLPEYTWSQDSEDIHIQFTVSATVQKADVYFTLTADHLEFGIKNGVVLLKGALHAETDVEGSTWTIDGQK